MLTDLLQSVAALVLLCVGGEALVRGAVGLGARLGLSALSMGLTVVAFGTSAPELVVSLKAGLDGAGEIALGNVIGSNIANIALIVGLAALLRPLRVAGRLARVEASWVVVATLLLLLLLADGRLSRLDGLVLVAGLVLFVLATLRAARSAGPAPAEVAPTETLRAPRSTGLAVLSVVGGLTLLVAGGSLLISAAVSLASSWGVGQAAIGLTVVAVGTSLPELATSLIAGLRGQGDIAVGNVVGSNLFNILGILGVSSLAAPLSLGALGAVDLALLLGSALTLAVILRLHQGLGRLGGALLVLTWAVYTTWLLAA